MGAVRETSEKLLRGELTTLELSPMAMMLGLEGYGPGIAFVASFANVTAVETAEGLVLFDSGSFLTGEAIKDELRGWSKAPVHTIVLTHGHVDHATGVRAFEAEGPVRVVAHQRVTARYERYRMTAGYNRIINARQFRAPGLTWPTDYRAPDVTVGDHLSLAIGGERIELFHDLGETDDHLWVWMPSRRALVTGDFFIWATPNCGNPQKVQRYPAEWARALRKMAELRPAVLFPGHGLPIEGEAQVARALGETAELLEHLVKETLSLLDRGATLDEILGAVRAPPHLLERPYLRPVYDRPEFVVRNLVRLYAGWWDGDPAHLDPPRAGALAGELCALAGGAPELAARARDLSLRGEHALASELVEIAHRASPGDTLVTNARREVYERRAASETSLMARSIYTGAAEE